MAWRIGGGNEAQSILFQAILPARVKSHLARFLVARIQATPGCTVADPIERPDLHLPALHQGHVLPDDLREFYEVCSGLTLFERSPCTMIIVLPMEVILANLVLTPGLRPDQLTSSLDDISWSWYLIAREENREYLTTDPSEERLGRCYDSFLGCHASPGYCAIVAFSFTELLTRLYEDQGERWLPDILSQGDAYDGIKGK